MEKKNNEGLFVVIGILVVIILILITLVGVLFFRNFIGQRETSEQSVRTTEEKRGVASKDTEEEDDLFGNEIGEDTDFTSNSGAGIIFVIDGFKMTIPSDYSCTYAEGIGPVVYMDDVFQMKTAILEDSMEEVLKEPSALTEKTLAAGGEVLQDVKETEIDGRQYAYFLADLQGDKCMVAYTQAADTDKRIGGQIVIESDSLTDEDLLQMFASIATTARTTDEPNSTMEDIMAQATAPDYGEVKEESTLSFGGKTVTYKVPKGFYSQGDYEADSYISETFNTADYEVSLDCILFPAGGEDTYEGAKDYIRFTFEGLADDEKEGVEMQEKTIDGKTCYFIVCNYEYGDYEFQRVYAACDIDKSSFFVVEASAIDASMELSMDTVQEFFVFK